LRAVASERRKLVELAGLATGDNDELVVISERDVPVLGRDMARRREHETPDSPVERLG
jgi:hypothetical protein